MTGLLRATWPLVAVIAASGFVLGLAWPAHALPPPVAGAALLLLAVALWASLRAGRVRVAAFFKGARGEEAVARALAFLPVPYRVFHGLSDRGVGPASDYDHVVVGPSGVFLVETKNWDGAISVEGDRILYNGRPPDRPPLEQVREAAAALCRRLRETAGVEVAVHPVLCFVADVLGGGSRGVSGVWVCTARGLNRAILDSCDPPLAVADQERVARCLRPMLDA